MYEQQSMEPDQEKRKKLVWEIDKRLTEDAARPIIYRYDARHLPLPAGARDHDDGQQHLQRLALRRRLARLTARSGV